MKIYNILLFVCFFSIKLFCEEIKKSQDTPRFHNIIMFLNSQETNKSGPISKSFETAYCQKCASLITTTALIVKNFIENNKITLDNLSEWLIYQTTIGDIIIFIPKGIEDDSIFNINTLEKIDPTIFSPKNDIKKEEEEDRVLKVEKLKKTATANKTINVNSIKSIFNTSKDHTYDLCNIVLAGHGSEGLLSKIPKQKNITVKLLKDSGGSVVGLSLVKFTDLLSFFSDSRKINTNFLYYRSCHAGGANQEFSFFNTIFMDTDKGPMVRWQEKPNFIIVSGTALDLVVHTTALESLAMCKSIEMPIGLHNYRQFFNLIKKYSQNKRFSTAELQAILKTITPTKKGFEFTAIPAILFPNTDKFIAFPLDNNTFVITNSMIKIAISNKNKNIDINNKNSILIYPTNIPIPLKIQVLQNNSVPILVSMLPFDALHKIDQIHINVPFSKFLRDIFRKQQPYSKFYYIEKLILINDENCIPDKPLGQYINLHNVLIEISANYLHSIFIPDDFKEIFTNNSLIKYETINIPVSKKIPEKVIDIYKNSFLNTIAKYFNFHHPDNLFNYYKLQELLDPIEQVLINNDIPSLLLYTSKFNNDYSNWKSLLDKLKKNSEEIQISEIQNLIFLFLDTLENALKLKKILPKIQIQEIKEELLPSVWDEIEKIIKSQIQHNIEEIIKIANNFISLSLDIPIFNKINNIKTISDGIKEVITQQDAHKFITNVLHPLINKLETKQKDFENEYTKWIDIKNKIKAIPLNQITINDIKIILRQFISILDSTINISNNLNVLSQDNRDKVVEIKTISSNFNKLIKEVPALKMLNNLNLISSQILSYPVSKNKEQEKSILNDTINTMEFATSTADKEKIDKIMQLNQKFIELYKDINNYIQKPKLDFPHMGLKFLIQKLSKILDVLEEIDNILKTLSKILEIEAKKQLENEKIKEIYNLINNFNIVKDITPRFHIYKRASNFDEISKLVVQLKNNPDKNKFIEEKITPALKEMKLNPSKSN